MKTIFIDWNTAGSSSYLENGVWNHPCSRRRSVTPSRTKTRRRGKQTNMCLLKDTLVYPVSPLKVLDAMFGVLQTDFDPTGATALILGFGPMQVELNDKVHFQPHLVNQIAQVCGVVYLNFYLLRSLYLYVLYCRI
jgi:hypothetical protein